MTDYLSKKQIDLLLQPIHPHRVLERDGMSYVEAYDIRAELNRVFGFGRWSTEILGQELVCETAVQMRNKKDGWYVVYKTSLRLTVQAPDGSGLCHYEESHVGESTHPVRGEAHGNALTNSHSYALKRCAHNLGDQFGLSLYNKGSREKIVRWTLVKAEEDGHPETADTNDVLQVTAESNGTAQQDDDWRNQPPVQGHNGRVVEDVPDVSQWETEVDWYRHVVDDLIPDAKDTDTLNEYWAVGKNRHEGDELTSEHWEEIKAFIRQRARELTEDVEDKAREETRKLHAVGNDPT